MKRITIGRGNDCDVVIMDDTDNVSRHHLVVSYDFFGKMKVSDTSSNGTFINGTRMLKGASIPVTREDKIRLGKSTNLDWDLVPDPTKTTRIATYSSVLCLIFLGLCFAGWYFYTEYALQPKESGLELQNTEIFTDDTWTKDSTSRVAPVATTIELDNAKKSIPSQSARKKTTTKKVSKQDRKSYEERAKVSVESNEGDSIMTEVEIL